MSSLDNAEPYDLVTVLSRLQGLEGMAHDIGRHSTDDFGLTAMDGERPGFFQKMLTLLFRR